MEEFLIRWTWENVHEVRPDLDKTQCMIVLTMVSANHDPNIGINYSTIYSASKSIYPILAVTIH